MTKTFSEVIDFIAFAVVLLILLIGSGTSHASPANSISVPVVESQTELVELSAWPRIRDALLGRERHHRPPHYRHMPPPPPPPPHRHHRFNPPPPPPPHHFRR